MSPPEQDLPFITAEILRPKDCPTNEQRCCGTNYFLHLSIHLFVHSLIKYWLHLIISNQMVTLHFGQLAKTLAWGKRMTDTKRNPREWRCNCHPPGSKVVRCYQGHGRGGKQDTQLKFKNSSHCHIFSIFIKTGIKTFEYLDKNQYKMRVKTLNLAHVLNIQNVCHTYSMKIKGQGLLLTLDWGGKLIKERDFKLFLLCTMQGSLLCDLPVETSARPGGTLSLLLNLRSSVTVSGGAFR